MEENRLSEGMALDFRHQLSFIDELGGKVVATLPCTMNDSKGVKYTGDMYSLESNGFKAMLYLGIGPRNPSAKRPTLQYWIYMTIWGSSSILDSVISRLAKTGFQMEMVREYEVTHIIARPPVDGVWVPIAYFVRVRGTTEPFYLGQARDYSYSKGDVERDNTREIAEPQIISPTQSLWLASDTSVWLANSQDPIGDPHKQKLRIRMAEY